MTEQLELRVTNTPDMDGDYFARIYDGNGQWIKSFMRQNRDDAIAEARKWVEWHRTRDDSEEVISL